MKKKRKTQGTPGKFLSNQGSGKVPHKSKDLKISNQKGAFGKPDWMRKK